MSGLNASEEQRLVNLCAIFNIRKSSTEDDPGAALAILNNLYSMPIVPDHDKRRNYGNQILKNSYTHFPPRNGQFTSEFHTQISTHVISMQEFPAWYSDLNKSPEELADLYQNMQTAMKWLQWTGVAAGSGTGAAGVGEFIKKSGDGAGAALKAGGTKVAGRLVGHGPITEGIVARYGAKIGTRTGAAGVVVIAASTLAYYHFSEECKKIREIIMHKYQEGKVNDETFKKVFTDINPNLIKKYWEM